MVASGIVGCGSMTASPSTSVGKIGTEGVLFYIGTHWDGSTPHSGRLWLGVNDDFPEDNRGEFVVKIERTEKRPAKQPAPVVEEGKYSGWPVPGARVLLLYYRRPTTRCVTRYGRWGISLLFQTDLHRSGVRMPLCLFGISLQHLDCQWFSLQRFFLRPDRHQVPTPI